MLALLRWHLWECHVTGGFLKQHGKMLLYPGSLALPSCQQVQAHPGLGGSRRRGFPKLQSFPICAPHSTHVTLSTVTSLVQILPLT